MVLIAKRKTGKSLLRPRAFFEGLFPRASKRRGQPNSGRRRSTRLLLEVLEDRTLLSASILGSVFHDLNANLTRDTGEAGLAGMVAFLDTNQNHVFDSSTVAVQGGALTPGSLGGFGDKNASVTVANIPARVT